MKKKHPLVSIISINYNQVELTCEMLKSLQNITYDNIEIIIVDNCSSTQAPDLIEQLYPEIKLIRSSVNLGFSGGNNLGINQSNGEYLLFLNNDTEVEASFLEPLIELFKKDSNIGIIGSKIRFFDTPKKIQYAGYTPMNPYTLRMNSIGDHEVDKGQYDSCVETSFVCGAAMIIPRKVIQKVGMMAEIYFLYYEEHDWCTRIINAGYKAYYQPKSLVLHKASSTTGEDSPLKTYYINRNRILYARRHSKGFILFLNFIYMTLISIPKNSFDFIFKRQFKLLIAYYKAIIWNFTHFKNLKKNSYIK